MRVLLVSKFLHHVGGVETYLRWQTRALVEAGHEVGLVGMTPPDGQHAMDFGTQSIWTTPTRSYAPGARGRIRSASTSVWSTATARVTRSAITEFRPDIVHFHGTCYQLTPSVVVEAKRARLPIIMTAHEYKLLCANQTLYDDNRHTICVKCAGTSRLAKFTIPLRASCMKGSRAVTAIGALEGRVSEPIWRTSDPLILAPSQFMRQMLLGEGWPEDRVRYLDLPWRTENQEVPTTPRKGADSILFLGRLAPIKGADVLLRVWCALHARLPDVQLRIAGDGEARAELEAFATAQRLPRVSFLGQLTSEELQEELARAAVTAHPSQCHENSPFSVRESLMAGVPAVVSDVGGMPEMVEPATGAVVRHDDIYAWAENLAAVVRARQAGTPTLTQVVLRRAMTAEEHLIALINAYSDHMRAEGVLSQRTAARGAAEASHRRR